MLIDSRDMPRTEDGLPIIADRDRLPLVWLLNGAQLTDGFERELNQLRHTRDDLRRVVELHASREAVCYELTLPAWWHFAPVRSQKLPNEPKLKWGAWAKSREHLKKETRRIQSLCKT